MTKLCFLYGIYGYYGYYGKFLGLLMQARCPPERNTFGSQLVLRRFISEDQFNLLQELKAVIICVTRMEYDNKSTL